MKYNFDTVLERPDSLKWKAMKMIKPDVSPNVVPFTVADMEFPLAPEINKGLKEFLDEAVLGYTARGESYYKAVIGWMENRHNWKIEKEWIIGMNSVLDGVAGAVKTFTEPGDGIIVMTPIYNPFYTIIENYGRRIIRSPLIEKEGYYEINFENLKENAKMDKAKMIIFCSPHNPVGRVWMKQELEKVVQIAVDNNLTIVSDEIHQDLIMPGKEHTVLANISAEAAKITITCTSATKSFNLAGVPNANIIISDETLRAKFKEGIEASPYDVVNAISAKACEIAYENGGQWIDSLNKQVYENQKIVKEFFDEKFPIIKTRITEGTYLQWIDFRDTNIAEKDLEDLFINKAEVFFNNGSMYGEEAEGFFRMNVACPKKVIEDALLRLESVLSSVLE